MTGHRPHQTDDGLRCSCGSERCLALPSGVWTPDRIVEPDELAAAQAFLGTAYAARIARDHGHAITTPLVATMQRQDGRAVVWTYSPRPDA